MNQVLNFHKISYILDHKPLLQEISGSIRSGDQIGLIGPNGVGKSTLLNIISQKIQPALGSVNLAPNNSISYFEKSDEKLTGSGLTIFDYLSPAHDEWWQILEFCEQEFHTIFSPEMEIKNLSGGEYTILQLGTNLYREPDLVILDEPTIWI